MIELTKHILVCNRHKQEVRHPLVGLLVLFSTGIVGWKIFERLRLPAPDLLGALFFASVLGVSGVSFPFPSMEVTFLSKLIIGSYIGLMVDRKTASMLKKAAFPAIIVATWMLSTSVGIGFLLYYMTDLPLSTALLGSTAGGVSEMALLGLSLNADTVTITLLQVFRVILFLVLMPFLAQWMNRRKSPAKKHIENIKAKNFNTKDISKKRSNPKGILILSLTAVSGGLIGRALGLPAGDLLATILFVALLSIKLSSPPRVHPLARSMARIGVGLSIAQQVTKQTLQMLSTIWLPILILALAMILSGIVLSWILHKTTGWDCSTCLLASSPGGLSQMSIIADEVGANPLLVSALHTTRLISILTFLPILFRFLLTRYM